MCIRDRNRLDCIIAQMKEAEGITEELKAQDQMAWVRACLLYTSKGKKESLRSVAELLKWADRYQEKDMPEIRSILGQYSYKVVER